MGDIFNEQLVKKQTASRDIFIKSGIIILLIIVSFGALIIIPGFALIIIMILIFGAYYLISNMNLEYEYIFTNGELDIDCVYNKTKRKRLLSCNLKDVELMAHVEDKVHQGDFKSAKVIKDFSSGVIKPNSYAFLTNYKNERLKVIIEPNEAMIKAFSTFLTPRRFFK